jgi:hypothetical protein
VEGRNSSPHLSEICSTKPTDLVSSAVRIRVPGACVHLIPSDTMIKRGSLLLILARVFERCIFGQAKRRIDLLAVAVDLINRQVPR